MAMRAAKKAAKAATSKKAAPKKAAPRKACARKPRPAPKATTQASSQFTGGSWNSVASRPSSKSPQPKKAPFNAETAKVLRDADAGKDLVHYSSLEEMFESWDSELK